MVEPANVTTPTREKSFSMSKSMTTLDRKTFILLKCLCSILPEESTKNTTSVFEPHPENMECHYFESILKMDRQRATTYSYIKRRIGTEYRDLYVIHG